MNKTQLNLDGATMYRKILGKPFEGKLDGIRQYTVNHLYGTIWPRSDLSIRDRRLITLALLAAQGYTNQLEKHIYGALEGEDPLSDSEILEIMIQVSHYASWAAGTSGQEVAQKVIDEEKSK